jgi:translation initiation factor 3 subunit E
MADAAAVDSSVEDVDIAQYDLTSVIGQYLDRHLALPLVEFLEGSDEPKRAALYDEKTIQTGKLALLSETNMVDFALDMHKDLYPDQEPDAELKKKRQVVVDRLKQLNTESAAIIQLLEHEDVQEALKSKTDSLSLRQELQDKYNMKPESLDTLYEYAKFLFECGKYPDAASFLYWYYILSTDPAKNFSSLWGLFACAILMHEDETAFDYLQKLKDSIDPPAGKNPAPALVQLQQRTWLIHWSLFVFFNDPKGRGRDGIIDLFLYQPQYANAIQTVCPHILRYLTTAVITNKRRKNVLKDLVKIIQQESYTYRDPITEFLECLYVNFDFDGAHKQLKLCEKVLANDFFLMQCEKDFMENARLFIFETYCRIHNTISLSTISNKLNMKEVEAEEWIVNLIRNARLDAKIDSKEGHVVMATLVPSIYQQVIEKTKTIIDRISMLAENIEKRSSESQSRYEYKDRGDRPPRQDGYRGGRGGARRTGGARGDQRKLEFNFMPKFGIN